MMWKRLSNGKTTWWEMENESYIYYNRGDGKWWIDSPDGSGLYIVEVGDGISEASLPPKEGWERLSGAKDPTPVVVVVGEEDGKQGQ